MKKDKSIPYECRNRIKSNGRYDNSLSLDSWAIYISSFVVLFSPIIFALWFGDWRYLLGFIISFHLFILILLFFVGDDLR